MLELRPYQIEALNVLHSELQEKDVLLLQAATGAGKTMIVCRMINRYFYDHPGRSFLVLMHKRELVSQFLDTFINHTEIKKEDIGICCAGLGSWDTSKRVTIATVQTLINKMGEYPGADLIVIDETHRVGHDYESQYQSIIATLRDYKPSHKVIGLTATAYRLNHGLIYGPKAKHPNFFPELTHRIKYAELRDHGYLMPLTGYIAAENASVDLQGVELVSGEYHMGQAGRVMGRYVSAAVDAMELYAGEHKHIAVFACTINHAETLLDAFLKRGHSAVVVHSQLDSKTRKEALKRWQSGVARVAISINILTEGFDWPGLSCLIFCRPTKSPVVWVQAIGRVLRIAENKPKSLMIDLTGNALEFGMDIDDPKFKLQINDSGSGEVPTKTCRNIFPDGKICGEVVHAACRVCPACGYEWTQEEVEALLPELKKVSFNKPVEAPMWHKVESMHVGVHENHNTGKKLLRVQFECEPTNYYKRPIHVSEWICLPDFYDGYAVTMGEKKWEQFTDDEFPGDVEIASWYANESFRRPTEILLGKDGKYHKILEYRFPAEPGADEDESEAPQESAPVSFETRMDQYDNEELPF